MDAARLERTCEGLMIDEGQGQRDGRFPGSGGRWGATAFTNLSLGFGVIALAVPLMLCVPYP